jgi:hypothetical protein
MIDKRIENIVNKQRMKMLKSLSAKQQELLNFPDPNNDYREPIQVLLKRPLCEIDDIRLFGQLDSILSMRSGMLLEEITIDCFRRIDPFLETGVKIYKKNSDTNKYFIIDLISDNIAYEIKYRAASNERPIIQKEMDKVDELVKQNKHVVYLTYYKPRSNTAIRLQNQLKEHILSKGGEYYCGEEAFDYILYHTFVDIKAILRKIIKGDYNVSQNTPENLVKNEELFILKNSLMS